MFKNKEYWDVAPTRKDWLVVELTAVGVSAIASFWSLANMGLIDLDEIREGAVNLCEEAKAKLKSLGKKPEKMKVEVKLPADDWFEYKVTE